MNRTLVVWTKDNPTPWNDIKPDEGTKLLTVNQRFDKGLVLSFVLMSRLLTLPCSWERKKL